MKKVIFYTIAFLIALITLSAALFVRQFPDNELATFTASVGNSDDCQVGGSPNTMRAGNVIWWYFNLPGVSESYLQEGFSFHSSAFHALTCQPDEAGYEENLRRVKRLILHAVNLGESIDTLGHNRFNLLHYAVIRSDLRFAQFLLEQGADPATLTRSDAVWYAKKYASLNAYELALALRENNWKISDEMLTFIKDASL